MARPEDSMQEQVTMAEKRTDYAMFDDVEVAGKFYKLGDPIDADVHPAVLQVLRDQGRISGNSPTAAAAVPADAAKPVEDMTRAELIAEAVTLLDNDPDTDDERLRALVTDGRERVAYRDNANRQDDQFTPDERLDGTVDEVKTRLDGINDKADLERLKSDEGKSKRPRSGVLSAIDARIAALG